VTGPIADAAETPPVTARTWAGFIAMSLGMLMAILDIQIVASSLPEIRIGLHLALDQLSWVQTAYLVAEIVAIPLTGWLTRALSTRGAFAAGMLGFTLASVACALADSFAAIVAARVAQGFCGGLLIPLVFSAIFLMFPPPGRTRPTVVAGLMAMLAPTLGPAVGGLITDTFTWHWLFLINVAPGIAVTMVVLRTVDCDHADWQSARTTDLIALPLLALFLGTLEVVLKEAPHRGWQDPRTLGLAALCGAGAAGTLWRSLAHPRPLIDLAAFRDRNFALGCAFSFALGVGLYGATYLLPVFLGVVRYYDEALQIGLVMTVTGGAQLLTAPVAAVLEQRFDARHLVAVGFALLALGLLGNGFMTYETDFWGLFWQQAVRGAAVMICLIAATSLALGDFDLRRVPDASGLFNLMRNLGGAIGLALIDTVIERRAPAHVKAIVERLQAGDASMARFVGLPTERFTGVPITDIDEQTRRAVEPLVRRAALVAAFNDAWLFIGTVVALSLLLLPFLRRSRRVLGPGSV
jgi:MFS transporter, DHA2 family, multidrug resistance protein